MGIDNHEVVTTIKEIVKKEIGYALKENNAKWMECIPSECTIVGDPYADRNEYPRGINTAINLLTANAKQAGLIGEEG